MGSALLCVCSADLWCMVSNGILVVWSLLFCDNWPSIYLCYWTDNAQRDQYFCKYVVPRQRTSHSNSLDDPGQSSWHHFILRNLRNLQRPRLLPRCQGREAQRPQSCSRHLRNHPHREHNYYRLGRFLFTLLSKQTKEPAFKSCFGRRRLVLRVKSLR